jgi:hypothetical protein
MAQPDEFTPAERIDVGRATVRSLKLLLKAIDDGDVVATPLEVERLQGAIEALGAVAGDVRGRIPLAAQVGREDGITLHVPADNLAPHHLRLGIPVQQQHGRP